MNNIATQLDLIMSKIWDSKESETPTTTALVSYVKSHANRRNVENVFEVIDILWSDNVRTIKQRDGNDEAGNYVVDVQFDDDSQTLVNCRCGIGHGLQLVG